MIKTNKNEESLFKSFDVKGNNLSKFLAENSILRKDKPGPKRKRDSPKSVYAYLKMWSETKLLPQMRNFDKLTSDSDKLAFLKEIVDISLYMSDEFRKKYFTRSELDSLKHPNRFERQKQEVYEFFCKMVDNVPEASHFLFDIKLQHGYCNLAYFLLASLVSKTRAKKISTIRKFETKSTIMKIIKEAKTVAEIVQIVERNPGVLIFIKLCLVFFEKLALKESSSLDVTSFHNRIDQNIINF
jgi:hypothetical protein